MPTERQQDQATAEAIGDENLRRARGSWREAQAARIDAMCDPRASIVGPDGKVGGIDPSPIPGWASGCGGYGDG